MRYEQLISRRNLLLAWRRITTAKNLQYKRFFRLPYQGYEIAAEANIDRLHGLLRGGWHPHSPDRVHLPKADGLQRPITLLHLEDQIVLQAIANSFARKLRTRRERVEGEVAYSNHLESPTDSIFFLHDWRRTYGAFQDKCLEHYEDGLRWVAHYDIAAFYDTISHDVLLQRGFPRARGVKAWNRIRQWLKVWASDAQGGQLAHGLPQGPVASDFLAECMMLPIDEYLSRAGIAYVRYVDDIRIFARTQEEVQAAVIQLELLCRGDGLIPQGTKFRIERASSAEAALGSLPSIAPPDDVQGGGSPSIPSTKAERLFREALSGRPLLIRDKSKARYVLYRAPPSPKILGWAVKLLPRHPEHIDAFVHYFSNYESSRQIVRAASALLEDGTPYKYVRGELWHVLARMAPNLLLEDLRPAALNELFAASDSLALEWGLFAFLIRCEEAGLGRIAHRVRFSRPLVQALLAPILPDQAYRPKGVVRWLLRSTDMHPGLGLSDELVQRELSHRDFDCRLRDLDPVLQNSLRALGIIRRREQVQIDQIATLLNGPFGTRKDKIWRDLLVREYQHALQILSEATLLFESHRSPWLQLQDSFNDIVFRKFLLALDRHRLPGGRAVVDRSGKLIDYGVLLDPGHQVSGTYPRLVRIFRDVHVRRNNLPGSHPYDKRGGAQTSYLRVAEQRRFRNALKQAYDDLINAVKGFP